MNDLERFFESKDHRLIHKFQHYFEIYDRHFKKYRGKEVILLEIGVSQGGSLQMWKEYFGPNAKIYGIDVNPECKKLEEENIEIHIGSQSDRSFLKKIKAEIPEVDILIDDGGHTMDQQIISFEELYGHVKEDGVYLCEDLHTSYFLEYGGGYKRRGTFIEYSKRLIDSLNAYHSRQKGLKISDFTLSTDSIHFYTSVLVVEKKPGFEVVSKKSGAQSFGLEGGISEAPIPKMDAFKRLILRFINTILRSLRLPGYKWR